MMDKPQKVTAILKVTAEFYDPHATPETVRACVEQDLEDAGYEVEVMNLSKPIKIVYEGPIGIYTRIGDVPDTNAGKWIPVKRPASRCRWCSRSRYRRQQIRAE